MSDAPAPPTESLGEALPRQIARVRDQVMPAYLACGEAGRPALMLMRLELDAATTALARGDVVAMIQAYKALEAWEV